jgi:hypothetical protein
LVGHFLLTNWVKGLKGSFFVRYFFKELGTSLYNAWQAIYVCEFGGGQKNLYDSLVCMENTFKKYYCEGHEGTY